MQNQSNPIKQRSPLHTASQPLFLKSPFDDPIAAHRRQVSSSYLERLKPDELEAIRERISADPTLRDELIRYFTDSTNNDLPQSNDFTQETLRSQSERPDTFITENTNEIEHHEGLNRSTQQDKSLLQMSSIDNAFLKNQDYNYQWFHSSNPDHVATTDASSSRHNSTETTESSNIYLSV